MTGIKHPIPVPRTVVRSLLDLLTEAKSYTRLHHEAVALIGDLTDMLARSDAPESEGRIAAELLEAIGLACKVELPTEPTLHSLRRAREVLAGLAVEAKIIDLPRAVTPDMRRDIQSEVSRQVDDVRGVDLRFCGIGMDHAVCERWQAVPRIGEIVVLNSQRRRVTNVHHSVTGVAVFVSEALT